MSEIPYTWVRESVGEFATLDGAYKWIRRRFPEKLSAADVHQDWLIAEATLVTHFGSACHVAVTQGQFLLMNMGARWGFDMRTLYFRDASDAVLAKMLVA